MKLDTFEKHFEEKILERGMDYLISGAVKELEEVDYGSFIAHVRGSRSYTVKIEINGNNVISAISCNCPYYDNCKHQVAALYALRGFLSSKGENRLPETEKLKELFNTESDNAIKKFTYEYAKKNRLFRKALFAQFADKTDIFKYARELITNSLETYTDEHGFIAYGKLQDALAGAYQVLEIIDEQIESGNKDTAKKLADIIIEELEIADTDENDYWEKEEFFEEIKSRFDIDEED